jgi:hypothetical protein
VRGVYRASRPCLAQARHIQEIIMNTTQSRRRFLAVLSAGAAATVAPAALAATLAPVPETTPGALAPAVASPSPDAGLLVLFGQYTAARSEYRRLSRKARRLDEKHDAATPIPDVLRAQPGDAELGLPQCRDHSRFGLSYVFEIRDLERLEWPIYEKMGPPPGHQFQFVNPGYGVRFEPPSAAARARADEIIKAYAKWDRARDREPLALRATSRQRDAAFKLADRLRTKIDRTRARTAAGLAVKAQVAAIEGEKDTQFADYTLASILRDMKALAKIEGARS